jgi:hypothetical protein
MSNFFTSNEDNCHISTGIAYDLVEDDQATEFVHKNTMFEIVNPT